MAIILDTIRDAMIEIGVINPIDEQTPQDNEYAMRTLNRIIDGYNIQNLMVTYLEDIEITRPDEGYSKEYELETTPIEISSLYWVDDAGNQYKSIEMTTNDWLRFRNITAYAVPVRHLVQKAENNATILKFNCFPIDNLTLHLLAKNPYTGTNGQGEEYIPTDNINWTRGFEKALMLRLAIEMCPSYGIEPSQTLIKKAVEAESNIKTYNFQPETLELDKTLKNKGRRSWRG